MLSSAAAEGAEPQAAPRGVPAPPGSPAADFEAWARERGVGAAITIASFGALRGCAASRAVAPGEPLLSIPADVLIYEDSVRGTDLVSAVRRAGGRGGRWPHCSSVGRDFAIVLLPRRAAC